MAGQGIDFTSLTFALNNDSTQVAQSAGVLFLDTFSSDTPTQITSHLPDLGGPWAEVLGVDMPVYKGAVTANFNDNNGYAYVDAGESNLVLTSHFVDDGQSITLWLFRWLDDTNTYAVYYESGVGWFLYVYTSAGDTELDSGSFAVVPGLEYLVEIYVNGAVCTVLVNGSPVLTSSACTPLPGQTTIGLTIFPFSDASSASITYMRAVSL
jgi:hypothetical protein